MGSSEHNSGYISPPNRLILSKWAFFIMFSLNMPTYPVILQIQFLRHYHFFSLLRLKIVMPSSRKIKYNNPTCIFPTHGEFSSAPPSCISHLFHFFLTSVHVLFITVGNDGIALQVLRLCSEHLNSVYITVFATQPSNSTAPQVSEQKIRAD